MISGVVFLDKPEGWTSRKAVDRVRKLYGSLGESPRQGKLKAGHAGTLDPLATGMLPILLGEATRFADTGLQADKCYEVTLDFSLQTDTLDREGTVTDRYDDSALPESVIDEVLAAWQGQRQQRPPQYSAIRIDGKRAYALARQGVETEMPLRDIHIHSLERIDYHYPLLSLRVHCSKGTYIRSLARDIGVDLHRGGCVCALRRLGTGAWLPGMMQTWEGIEADPMQALQPISVWLRDWPRLDVDENQARRFTQGQRLAILPRPNGIVTVYWQHHLLGMAEVSKGAEHSVLHPKNVLPSAQHIWNG